MAYHLNSISYSLQNHLNCLQLRLKTRDQRRRRTGVRRQAGTREKISLRGRRLSTFVRVYSIFFFRCVVHGCVDLPFELEGRVRVISALVVPALTTPLIDGTDFWRVMALVPNLSQGSWEFQDDAGEVVVNDGTGLEDHLEATQRETLDGVLREFIGRVGTPLGCTQRVQHVVDTGDSKPIKQRYYPVSPVLERAMHAEMDEMLLAGVVEPSKSAWSSPVVMIRKKDGSYRFCVDYRKVNAVTRRDAYPVHYVNHILDRPRNARYFSSLDAKSAYWQVPLSEESKERTAFTVPGTGLFQFTRMPFGLHNSPATWQRLIDQVLGPELERHVFVYLDDIIVCSAQFDKYVETLDRVFKKLKVPGLTSTSRSASSVGRNSGVCVDKKNKRKLHKEKERKKKI
ncbi:hypothetical protein AAG570_008403 [Ranatra chinensis]|uniref:Reverse transcriptase domain-containing protein n=1 Tax=Ranatra chinensis TaxID=642074 RepID=A0ABD0YQT8_9HEMI